MTPTRTRTRTSAPAQRRRAATEQAIYGRSATVDIEEPVAVLVQIWRRVLRLR